MTRAICTDNGTGYTYEADRAGKGGYGRLVCRTCGGWVFAKTDGTLRRHVTGSNRPAT